MAGGRTEILFSHSRKKAVWPPKLFFCVREADVVAITLSDLPLKFCSMSATFPAHELSDHPEVRGEFMKERNIFSILPERGTIQSPNLERRSNNI